MRHRSHSDRDKRQSYSYMAVDIVRSSPMNGRHDLIMQEISCRINHLAIQSDVVLSSRDDTHYRFYANSSDSASEFAKRVVDAFRKPILLGEQRMMLRAVIGIFTDVDGKADVSDAMYRAEVAMWSGLDSGRQVIHYSEEIGRRTLDSIAIEHALFEAIARREMLFHFQPQIDLESGKPVGAEALLRFPEGGALSRYNIQEIVDIANQTGLIHEIGEWGVGVLVEQQAAWRDEGLDILPVSINLSPREIATLRPIDHLDEALREYGIEQSMIEIEVTEMSPIFTDPEVLRALKIILERGYSLALDDFGAGYSNLYSFFNLGFSKIKIDRKMLSCCNQDIADLTRIVVQIGRNAKVVAEGVETEEQRLALAQAGCKIGQGWLFAKALPAPAFARRYLEKRSPT